MTMEIFIDALQLEWRTLALFAAVLACALYAAVRLERSGALLGESEARFAVLTRLSSDFYWESDKEHRLSQRILAGKLAGEPSAFRQGVEMGERRWEIPYMSPDEGGWRAYRALLDAHQPFSAFEHSRLGADGTERHISISGEPLFD